ncbi:hypothetical protein CEXT_118231 [Caerostris extrusa]|uniref:Uncharacterized protein n=1 Tax=Caerostris extrusa TaxID=172846 RepID=A0AAV4UKA8_CAEEX|nr:hypothetical protein CEXT_118231 [Caerostris extrusa]
MNSPQTSYVGMNFKGDRPPFPCVMQELSDVKRRIPSIIKHCHNRHRVPILPDILNCESCTCIRTLALLRPRTLPFDNECGKCVLCHGKRHSGLSSRGKPTSITRGQSKSISPNLKDGSIKLRNY